MRCSVCGASNPGGFRFCGSCGTALADADELQGNRRRVTILFADIVGFSTLAERVDPEELRELIAGTFSELTSEIRARGGAVEKFIGDAVMAVFGAPQAHEDDPVRAVESAIAMLGTVRLRSEGMPSPVRLRIGINTGLVVAGTVGDGTQTGVLGDAVNVAARLQQTAEPDQIVVSASVWRRIRDRFAGERVGDLPIKGRVEPVTAYRVSGPRAEAVAPRRTPFVGRTDELAALERAWSETLEGHGQVVSVIGEPGVGKSRLLYEFSPREGALDVRVDCEQGEAFGPLIHAIASIVGSGPGSDVPAKERLRSLGLDADSVELVGRFLGLEPARMEQQREADRGRVYEAVRRLLVAASRDRPILLSLNDLHWADAATIDLLRFLVDRVAGTPLMMLLTFRPEFGPRLGEGALHDHVVLRLEPLTADESADLACGFLRVHRLSDRLEGLVADRAEGNAFFIEELLRMLLDARAVLVARSKASLHETEIEIPETVESTIVARIDRLSSDERTAIGYAAVIGRTFSVGLLKRVLERDPEPVLSGLADGQLVLSEHLDTWTFKHALIQEVAYEGILLRRRREMHREVAEAIEAMHSDDPATLGSLAEHFARAGVSSKARRYAVAAGDVAVQRAGFVEAKMRYEAALDLWGEGEDEERLGLQNKLGYVALMASDLPLVERVLTPAVSGWASMGNDAGAGAALSMLGRAYTLVGDIERGTECLARGIELFGSRPSRELVQAHVWMASLHQMRGHVHEGLPAAKRGLQLAEELQEEGQRANLLNSVGVLRYVAGDAGGIDVVGEAEAVAEASGDPEAIARVLMNLGFLFVLSFRFREALDVCERGIERLEELGMPGIGSTLVSSTSTALMELGRYEEAERLALELLGPRRGTTIELATLHAGAALSQAWLRTGRYDDAERMLQEILPRARRMAAPGFSGAVLVCWAELLEATGRTADAAEPLSELLALAPPGGPIQYRSWALVPASRIAPSLAGGLIEELRERVDEPAKQVVLTEARGNLSGDRSAIHDAAEAYAVMGMPYQEARCRLEAGEIGRVRELADGFGLAAGPLGAKLDAVSAGAARDAIGPGEGGRP
jgi:adenylate cyclase